MTDTELRLDQRPPDDGWIIFHDQEHGAILHLGANYTRRLYEATIANDKLEYVGLTEEAKTLDDLTVPLRTILENDPIEKVDLVVVPKAQVIELQQRAEAGVAADSITIADQSRRLAQLDQLLITERAESARLVEVAREQDAQLRSLREQLASAEAALLEPADDEYPDLNRAADAAEDRVETADEYDDIPVEDWPTEFLLNQFAVIDEQRKALETREVRVAKVFARRVLEEQARSYGA